MAWNTVTVGTMGSGTANPPSLSPGAPSGSGGILFLLSGIKSNGTCLTPTGWTDLVDGDSSRIRLSARIATGGADDTPTVTYSTSADANAHAQIIRAQGGPTTLTGILDASNSKFTAAEGALITVPTLTPVVDNCLCLFMGYHKAANGPATALPFSSGALGDDNTQSFWMVWSYEIQTTKTTRSGGSFTATSSAASDTRSIVASLVSGALVTSLTPNAAGLSV